MGKQSGQRHLRFQRAPHKELPQQQQGIYDHPILKADFIRHRVHTGRFFRLECPGGIFRHERTQSRESGSRNLRPPSGRSRRQSPHPLKNLLSRGRHDNVRPGIMLIKNTRPTGNDHIFYYFVLSMRQNILNFVLSMRQN